MLIARLATLSLGLSFASALGCAHPGPINAKNPAAIANEMNLAFTQKGLKCTPRNDAWLCEGQKSGSLNFVYEAAHSPERVMISAPFQLKSNVSCEAAGPALAAFNLSADMGVATCQEQTGGALVLFSTWLLVPASGYDAKEVGDFVLWWSGNVRESLHKSRIDELLDDGSAPTPATATPPSLDGGTRT
jgi:hypothetical protein